MTKREAISKLGLRYDKSIIFVIGGGTGSIGINKLITENIEKYIYTLTSTLDVYAEDKAYVKTINSIINSNKLTQFDSKYYNFINS